MAITHRTSHLAALYELIYYDASSERHENTSRRAQEK